MSFVPIPSANVRRPQTCATIRPFPAYGSTIGLRGSSSFVLPGVPPFPPPLRFAGRGDEWHLHLRKPRGDGGIGRRGLPGEDDGRRPPTGTEPAPMRHHHPGSFRRQATDLRRQFLQDGGLPFADVLTEDVI